MRFVTSSFVFMFIALLSSAKAGVYSDFRCLALKVPVELIGVAESATQKPGHDPFGEIRSHLSTFCQRNAALAKSKIQPISLTRFVVAEGATEPSISLVKGILSIEFFGGGYDRKKFERDLRLALRGKTPKFDD